MAKINLSGDKKLADKRLERFCQLLASDDISQEKAWQETAPAPITALSARNGGSRAYRRPAVNSRVSYLRVLKAKEDAAQVMPISNDPLVIMEGVSEVLRRAYEVAKKEGLPAQKMASLRKAFSIHISRYSDLQNTRKPAPKHDNAIADQFWSNVSVCQC